MNNKGKGSGLSLILILVVVLIVAWLAVKNMSSLNHTNTQTESTQDPVQQTKDAVDAINDQQQKALDALEGFGE